MIYVDGLPTTGKDQAGGWGFQILPYIEQTSLWLGSGVAPVSDPIQDQINRSIPVIKALIPAFFCPTRRAPSQGPSEGDWYKYVLLHGHLGRVSSRARSPCRKIRHSPAISGVQRY
jgi:hypothetical protein